MEPNIQLDEDDLNTNQTKKTNNNTYVLCSFHSSMRSIGSFVGEKLHDYLYETQLVSTKKDTKNVRFVCPPSAMKTSQKDRDLTRLGL